MRHAYYMEKTDGSVELLEIAREPLAFKDACRYAIANEVTKVFSLRAMSTHIEADKVQSNKLFELDGMHDLLDDVAFVKDDYVSGNYMIFKNEYSAIWIIPDMIKKLFQKEIIWNVKFFEEGVTITAECKNGLVKDFDFTRQQQWWNMQFERQVCDSFDQYNEIHMWIIDIMMKVR